MSKLKIATWNVNSLRARLESVCRWLREASPDIVLLQETKVVDALFPKDPLEELGYNIEFFGEKSYNGVAILSKSPLEDVQRGLNKAEALGTRYLEAFTCGVRVASIYAPNGESLTSDKFQQKRLFYACLLERLCFLRERRDTLVWGGDYNVAPFDADVWDPEAWRDRILCSSQERRWFRALVNAGLYDVLHAEGKLSANHGFTWWDYRTRGDKLERGLRIDHLLLSPGMAERLAEGGVDKHVRLWEKPSDHAPAWVCLQL